MKLMHMLSKVIAFPVSSKRSGRFSAVAFPRFAVAFGDRDTAPLSIVAQPNTASRLPADAPSASPSR
jgi:hypothetical protein|tara:strand:+ start:4786 stop:4986 length:201 start_codon:yes stop_codon:yes gene_type:complete